MELLLHQWGDWPELYRNTDKTEATEIVIIDSQMNYRGKLDTYAVTCRLLCPAGRKVLRYRCPRSLQAANSKFWRKRGLCYYATCPPFLRGGWRAPIYSLAPPCLSGGKGTGFIGSRQTTENPVTRFPPGRERATKWRGGIVKGTLLEAASRNETPYGDSRRRRPIKTIAAQRQSTTFSREAAVKSENLPPPFFESSREALIKSLSDLILEFLCNARNGTTRIASYLRSPMTKQCIKILIKADSAN